MRGRTYSVSTLGGTLRAIPGLAEGNGTGAIGLRRLPEEGYAGGFQGQTIVLRRRSTLKAR